MRARAWGIFCAMGLAAVPLPAAPSTDNDGREEYVRARELQRKGKWTPARKAFRKFLDRYPDSPHARDAANRSGDNAYLGCTRIWEGGPSERRIDVAVMGDGFTVDSGDQRLQEKWAKLCVDVLFHEQAFSAYRNYFNIYFVRLASLEEGVDPKLTPAQLAKIEEKNRYRSKRRQKKTDFSTALECKAIGPQGQVMADRRLVYKWLDIAEKDLPGTGHDRFVIAFARFGKLGMGGGGVANVGRPDKSVTVHEFGHAFSRLLDEYQVNPNPPTPPAMQFIRAANASVSPDPKRVPWAHMLEARVKGVGVYEGGATYKKGVWRPARTCAMNAKGANQFCPVCREATILVIYEYVSPIDASSPPQNDVVAAFRGDDTVLSVTPMRPEKRKLQVDWFVEPVEEDEPHVVLVGGARSVPASSVRRGLPFARRGRRVRENRSAYAEPAAGERSKLGKIVAGSRKRPRRALFPVGKLAPGRYRVTAEVRDETSWVVKDPNHLLVERVTWMVRVAPRPAR